MVFQFQYGAIKRRILISTPSILCNFNSSMVRLRVIAGSRVLNVPSLFQFQYGAIKRF